MSTKHTISINGQTYDVTTGMPVHKSMDMIRRAPASSPVKQAQSPVVRQDARREPVHPATAIHEHTQKSSTLRRGHLAAPKSTVPTSAPHHAAAGHVGRSPMISRFASHPQPFPKHHEPKPINDIGPVAQQLVVNQTVAPKLTSQELKEKLLARAGNKVDHAIAQQATPKKEKVKRLPLLKRIQSRHLVVASVAVLLLGGYISYISIPGISVRLAASQAGVNAKYPEYNPDGYSFQGPVAFQQGEVELHFKSNGGGEGFTIRQQNSNWNSVAVLDNLVNRESKGKYQENSQGGVTVYTYGTRAAWTNGGVLYTIDGNAPLSPEQLLHIASSM